MPLFRDLLSRIEDLLRWVLYLLTGYPCWWCVRLRLIILLTAVLAVLTGMGIAHFYILLHNHIL